MKTLLTILMIWLINYPKAQTGKKDVQRLAGRTHVHKTISPPEEKVSGAVVVSPLYNYSTEMRENSAGLLKENYSPVRNETVYPSEGAIIFGSNNDKNTWNYFNWYSVKSVDNDQPASVLIKNLTVYPLGNASLIKWETSSEINNNNFTIERQISDNEYLVVGVVKGSGTNSSVVNYSYTDNAPEQNAINYYRIVQHNYDGLIDIFGPVNVRIGDPENSVSWPNPFINSMSVKIPGEIVEGKIVITTILGKVMFEHAINENETTLFITTESWPAGNYYITISSPSYIKTNRVMKL